MKTFQSGNEKHLTFARYRKTALAEAIQIDEPFCVETLEGVMTARAGDYLMRGPAGELYPCAREIFEQTYEPAAEEAPV